MIPSHLARGRRLAAAPDFPAVRGPGPATPRLDCGVLFPKGAFHDGESHQQEYPGATPPDPGPPRSAVQAALG